MASTPLEAEASNPASDRVAGVATASSAGAFAKVGELPLPVSAFGL